MPGGRREVSELFQVSYEWIYDSGATRHFCKGSKADAYIHLAKIIKGVMGSTADRKVRADKLLSMRIERPGNMVSSLLLLPDTPALFSAGVMERNVFTSIGAHGKLPCLVESDTN